jgi:hypothetical protein
MKKNDQAPSLGIEGKTSEPASEAKSGFGQQPVNRLLPKSSALSLGTIDSMRCEVAVGRSFPKAQSDFCQACQRHETFHTSAE